MSQLVEGQILTGVKVFAADDTLVRPFSCVLSHVSLESLRAGVAALALGALKRFLSCVGTGVPAHRGGLEETHPAVDTAVRLFRLFLVRLLVLFAVTRLGESLSADGAGKGSLPGVNALMPQEFVKFIEWLHTKRTMMRNLRLPQMCAFMPR